jgi:RNA ligase
MKFDLNLIEKHIKDGLVVKNDHPTLPISIYNYSRKAIYDRVWDNITKSCRALVLDREGYVVAKAFDKFFNIEELSKEEIPAESFEVYEKLDGSLILVFRYLGELVVASKGSFTSDHSVLAKKLINEKYDEHKFYADYIYVFELIGPSNKIVLDYPEDELVLLCKLSKKTWEELPLTDSFIRPVNRYDSVKDYTKLKEIIPSDKEGFVVRFKNGFRMKIKGNDYFRLHSIITNFSNIKIWEILKNGEDLAPYLENVPDEFDKWVKSVKKDLNFSRYVVMNDIGKSFDYYMYGKYNDKDRQTDRKKFAEWVLTNEKWTHPVLFRMFDGKDYDDLLWKLVKPKFSKPFFKEE